MTALTDRITEVLRQHVWFDSELDTNGELVNPPTCRCGLQGGVKAWAAHVAEQIAAELNLREERIQEGQS